MRDYSTVSPVFWTGKTGRRLKQAGPDAMLVAMYLVTSPHSNAMGMFYLPTLYISHETGLSLEGASKALSRACEAGFCAYDEEAEVVWVFEMARFQIGEELSLKDNRVKWVNDEYHKLPKCAFLKDFFDKYAPAFHLKETREGSQNRSPLEGPLKPHRSQEQDQEQEQDLRDTPSDEGVLSSEPPASADTTPTEKPERGAPDAQGQDVQPAQAEPETGEATPKRTQDRTPHQAIVALYHEILPMCPRVKVWNPEQKSRLRTRWKERPERQSLDWWRDFFQRVAASDWLTGRVKDFVCDLDWLVGPKNMAKVLNGRFDNRGPRTGSRQTDRNIRAAQAFIQGD